MLFHHDGLVLLAAGITCDGVGGTFRSSIGATSTLLNCAHLIGHVGMGISVALHVPMGLMLLLLHRVL